MMEHGFRHGWCWASGAMTAPHITVAGATTAITRRTSFRKGFLAPWHPLVRDIWLYSLADAQRHTNVAIHHGVMVINHHHLDVTPSSGNLPEFTRRVHVDMSCALNTLLARERYDAPRELWDGRIPHYMRLLDAAAQASHLVYEHVNCVAAGLVDRPEHMPDHVFDFGLWRTGCLEVDRPPVYFDSKRPERLRLYVTPPPLLYLAFGGDLDALIHHMGCLSENAIRSLRAARKRSVAGARRIIRLHPWSEPRSLRESGGERVPSFRIGARGVVAVRMNVEAARETRHFRDAHESARLARRDGDYTQVFPYGTYAMRVVHGASVEHEPSADAFLGRPGPLLCDVKAQLAADAELRVRLRKSSKELSDEVNAALEEEAQQIEQHTALELSELTRAVATISASAVRDATAEANTDERAGRIVRHRFANDHEQRERIDARRVVVLRDRRRGRPSGRRHGSDPPV